jgi:hypothetical protein
MVGTVKTAVSLRRELFEQGQALAGRLRVSRSRLFALALDEFIRRHQNRRLLERLNRAYGEPPDASERAALHAARRRHRRLVEGEWFRPRLTHVRTWSTRTTSSIAAPSTR